MSDNNNRRYVLQLEGMMSRLLHRRYRVDFSKLSVDELVEMQRFVRDMEVHYVQRTQELEDKLMFLRRKVRRGF